MRKFLAFLLIAATMLCLFGCKQDPSSETKPNSSTTTPSIDGTDPIATSTNNSGDSPDSTEPEDPTEPPEPTGPTEPDPVLDTTQLYGIDVTGMTSSQAMYAIRRSINAYKLTLGVNGESLVFSGKDLGMSLSTENFYKWFEEALAGNNPDTIGLIKYDITDALATIHNHVAKEPVNATISYDETKLVFGIKPHEDGIKADVTPAERALIDAISTLSPNHSVTIPTEPIEAQVKEDDPRLNGVTTDANGYLDLKITYTYKPNNLPSYSETISRETLATFVTLGEDLSVVINTTAVTKYIASKSETFSGSSQRGFTTTHGTVINMDVEYYDNTIDQEAMFKDLMNCLKNKISPYSGTARFIDADECSMAYGGNYIEIDLNNQCLWLYKDGLLVTSSPLTSGTVLYGYCTPTGVYSIQKKSTCVTLTGPTWASYVTYWMPFYGAYGLHDATWRTNFGGTTYLKDGSHGCINLPFAQAELIFKNISVGTKVIIYGGARTMDPMAQELFGKTSYSVNTSDSAFNLNVKTTFKEPVLTYHSSNTNVVTVDASGNVTIVGPGEATITVTSPAIGYVSEATLTISITVTGDPIPTEPDDTVPDSTGPEATDPDIGEPENTVPEQTDPVPTEPPATEPAPSEQEVSENIL